ncbi:hypothetical protein TCAL_08779 [Tigriopus californicus]|uniref:Uncharacterized protein n=1 Tax=Tigriopus californicus TaxID=6832 RepID=A0A553PI99_TIGCA|nr:uncharacterized protein LOC131881350 [Tigriopus californicus]TRY77412.1 hypothetical protein TCAL_08779 [Tigriopus californicus]|eukprot:TCALIF_08779-PA protein Name:"Protein of unknown function" AED:0.22 eAED:0.22 QI:121/1/0.5/1/0/0.5/2/0/145
MNLKRNNVWFELGKPTTVFLFIANILVRFTNAQPIHEVHTKNITPSQSSPPQFTIEPLDGNQNPETVLPSPRDPLRSFGRFRQGSIGKLQDWTLEPKTTASSDWSRGQARRPPLKSVAPDLSRTWIWEESQIEDNLIDKSDPFIL